MDNHYLLIGSKCYRVVSSSANYLQAILGCVSLGASLATVSSQAEQDAVFALTGASGAWIGLTDFLNEGTFSWVDESPLTFTNWRVNQPNNGNNNQHCTQVSLGACTNITSNKQNILFRFAPTETGMMSFVTNSRPMFVKRMPGLDP